MSKRKKPIKQNRQTHNVDDYDLKRSLGKLNQKREFEGGSTNSDFETQDFSNRINSSSFATQTNENTGFFLQINDTINSRYDKLKDDISCVSDKIGESTSDLREEIDKKLDKKVSEKLFYGAVSAIVLIVSLVYLLSYSELIKDNKQLKPDVNSIKTDIIDLKKAIDLNKNKIEHLEKETSKIEKTKHNNGS